MKHIIFLSIVIIAFGSCQKEELQPIDNSITSNFRTKSIEHFFDDGTNYGCLSPAGDCLPEIIISPSLITTMNQIFIVINNGNQQAIQNSFSSNSNYLLDYIDQEDVNGVINGTETVTAKGTNPNQTRYMKFSSGNNLIAVYPITKQ